MEDIDSEVVIILCSKYHSFNYEKFKRRLKRLSLFLFQSQSIIIQKLWRDCERVEAKEFCLSLVRVYISEETGYQWSSLHLFLQNQKVKVTIYKILMKEKYC